MRGFRGVLMVGVGLLVVAAVGVWLVGASSGESGDSPGDEGEVPLVEPPVDGEADGGVGGSMLSAERAREFEGAVNSRDPQRLVDVLLVGDEHDPVEVAEQALPAGSQLVVDEETFTRVGDDGGVVKAMLVGEQEFSVQLLLVEADGRWLVTGSSEPKPSS